MIAILSDIHSNIDALEAVLEDVIAQAASTVICLGDIVGYGPEPGACVEVMRELSKVTLMGNHELMMLMKEELDAGDFGKVIGGPLSLAREQLGEEGLTWIQHLPLVAEAGDFTLVHGSLENPQEFFYIDTPEAAARNFRRQSAPISFHGHTHYPSIWEDSKGEIQCYEPVDKFTRLETGRKYAICVGSVGQPRDGDPRSCYLLYDPSLKTLCHRRVPYDIAHAQARFKAAGLPVASARRLNKGN